LVSPDLSRHREDGVAHVEGSDRLNQNVHQGELNEPLFFVKAQKASDTE